MDKNELETASKRAGEEQVNEIISNLQNRMATVALDEIELKRKQTSKRNGIMDITLDASSKGSKVNIIQMAVDVGQTYVKSNRVFDRLPHFGPSETHRIALQQGLVRHSFSGGLDPQSYYMHAMGGREGLTDTGVKTSITGYIERKLIKMLENLRVRFHNI